LGGINFIYSDPKLSGFGFFININTPIRADNVAFIPNFRFGFSYITDDYYKEYKELKDYENKKNNPYSSDSDMSFPFIMDLSLFAGFKITTTFVPGLFSNVGLLYNIGIIGYDSKYKDYGKKFDMALIFSIGYAF